MFQLVSPFLTLLSFFTLTRTQCTPNAARSSDTLVPNNPGVNIVSSIPSQSTSISLNGGWEWHTDGVSGHPLSPTTATQATLSKPGTNNEAERVWNGVLCPTTANTQNLFPLYSTTHNISPYYKLSFKFHQGTTNRDMANQTPTARITAHIFSRSKLNATNAISPDADTKWSMTPGATWGDYRFSECVNVGDVCHVVALNVMLRADSIAAGHSVFKNFERKGAGITFKTTKATTATQMEAVFQFDSTTLATPCLDCIVAFRVEVVGEAEGAIAASWTIADLVFERLGQSVGTLPPEIDGSRSEVVEVIKMPSLASVEASPWPRSNCPHLHTGLKNWDDPATWGGSVPTSGGSTKIMLPANSRVLIRSCSLSSSWASPYARIEVPAGSELIFDDQDIDIYTTEIFVKRGGKISVGSPTCRLYSKIRFFFVGSRTTSSLVHDNHTLPSKGLIIEGEGNIMGKQYHPTWTRLSRSVNTGGDILYLQDAVNWEVGQTIVVLTSRWNDSPAMHKNERRTIVGISPNRKTIQVNRALSHFHYAGVEYQAEVLLLSRRILFEGNDSGDKFGHHSEIRFGAKGHLAGIESFRGGQQNILGRYPYHFHLNGNGITSRMSDCSTHDSFFRCATIHGTNNLTLATNVAFNISGHCYYIEDGVEENNTLLFNAAAHIHPIARAAAGPEHGEFICSGCQQSWSTGSNIRHVFTEEQLVLPADTAASGFYVSNAFNNFIGNVASGGWAGFAFINMETPLGTYKGQNRGTKNPWNRPTLVFNGNTAHSSGFYWKDSGSCIYVGGRLYWDPTTNKLSYQTGRIAHPTRTVSGANEGFMVMNNTKAYLCHLGILHWGERSGYDRYESHDNFRMSFLIGDNFVDHALVNGRSGNTLGWKDHPERMGFLFYDTFVRQFMNDITFRNFRNDEPIIKFLTFSQRFLPQAIAALNNIKFENCTNLASHRLFTDWCGPLCRVRDMAPIGADKETQAARIMATYDYDGTSSLTYKPTIVGATRLFWNYRSDCVYDNGTFLWYCPYDGKEEIAFIDVDVVGVTNGVRDENAGLGRQDSFYPSYEGYFSLWGPMNFSCPFGSFPGMAGPTGMGWYMRPHGGAPKTIVIGALGMNMPRSTFVLLTIKYPPNTNFSVKLELGDEYNYTVPHLTKSQVMQAKETLNPISQFNCPSLEPGDEGFVTLMCTNTGGVGPAWHWDGKFFYLRVVYPVYYNMLQYRRLDFWTWTHRGMKLGNVNRDSRYIVETTCPGCASSPVNSALWDVADELPPAWPGQTLKLPPPHYNGPKAEGCNPCGTSAPDPFTTGAPPATTAQPATSTVATTTASATTTAPPATTVATDQPQTTTSVRSTMTSVSAEKTTRGPVSSTIAAAQTTITYATEGAGANSAAQGSIIAGVSDGIGIGIIAGGGILLLVIVAGVVWVCCKAKGEPTKSGLENHTSSLGLVENGSNKYRTPSVEYVN